MITKTSIHWQGQAIPDWGKRYMVDSGAQYVKVMDPGEEDPFPGYKSIVRTAFYDDNEAGRLVALGAVGADIWMDGDVSAKLDQLIRIAGATAAHFGVELPA